MQIDPRQDLPMTRNRRHRVAGLPGWARPGAQDATKVIVTTAVRDTKPPTADAPSVKDPQSNQLSSMLATAEDRAFRARQARLVERPLPGRAIANVKTRHLRQYRIQKAHLADAKSTTSGSTVSKYAICSLRVCRVSESLSVWLPGGVDAPKICNHS